MADHYKNVVRLILMDGDELERLVARAVKAQTAVDLILEDVKEKAGHEVAPDFVTPPRRRTKTEN